MINTKELEKRWYKYKAKGLILIFSILSTLTLLIYGGYYILYKLDLNINFGNPERRPIDIAKDSSKTIEKSFPQEINSTQESNKTFIKEIEIVEEKVEEIEKSKDVLLAPTIPIVDLENEKRKDRRDTNEKKRVAKKKRVNRKKRRLVKAKKDTYLTAKELTVVKSKNLTKNRERKKINLHGSSNNYMSIMKNKFRENKNPREALLIAKAYYKAGNYKNAEEWALKANNLDKKLDESWLVFAKAQEKLGKRNEALKVLVAYYRTSKSPKAKALIRKIKTESI